MQFLDGLVLAVEVAVVSVRRVFLYLFGTAVVEVRVGPDPLHLRLFHHALKIAFGFVDRVIHFGPDPGPLLGDFGGELKLLGWLVGGLASGLRFGFSAFVKVEEFIIEVGVVAAVGLVEFLEREALWFLFHITVYLGEIYLCA